MAAPQILLVDDNPTNLQVLYQTLEGQGYRLLAARTGDSNGQPGKVYFPPKEADPATGLELDQFVELNDKGTVTTFAIINIPFPGQRIKPPYVAAYVLLDGADIPFLHRWGKPLLYGPGSIHLAHTADEWIALDELAAAVDGNTRLARALLALAS